MKKKISSIIALPILLFLSCNKEKVDNYRYTQNPPPPQPPITDTLSGKEFVFDSLTWVSDYEDFMDIGETFVTTPERPDLFNSFGKKEVSFKFNNASTWIYAQDYYYYSPNQSYYWYYSTRSHLRILSNNLNSALIGQQVTVRIKFL
jgi:hypothetical protein